MSVIETNKNHPKVSIIILNWNGLKDTIECLESLKKITYPNYKVIVVDNASSGDDVKVLREKFGDYIHIIQNDKNYGYTGGNNIGIRHSLASSQPDYFLILNPDTVVNPDFLSRMTEAAQKDALIGIAGPKVYYYEKPNCIQSAGAKINMWTGRASHIGINKLDTGQYNYLQEVDFVSGCCILIKADAISNVGLFDESFFCYWEEVDYCIRAKRTGYKVMHVPEAKIWHKAPMKRTLWKRNQMRNRPSGFTYYYMARNNFRFMRKHATRRRYLSFLTYFFGLQLWILSGFYLAYFRDIKGVISFYRGVKDGFLNQ